jgi:methylenetetrahydrofolate dehydrogenase (NADP+)/methenyltetrahydrofolate cyclohydrolase
VTILYGKDLSDQIREDIRREIRHFPDAPGLAVVLIGEDPASQVYVRNKKKACEEVGIASYPYYLSSDIPEDNLLALIQHLNNNQNVHGILVQLPLPEHIRESKVIDAISWLKDVDGFHPYNVARLFSSKPGLVPCTPLGIIELLERNHIQIAGRHAVIVGSSYIVGKPLSLLLLNKGATVTVCHKYTQQLDKMTRQGDILISAVGKSGLITRDMVKTGAVLIDIGISFKEGKTVGDVDFDNVLDKVSYITPVPGGVGPLTVTMLLKNTLLAYKMQNNLIQEVGQ